MPYTYTLRSIIPATPQQIYAAWLDSLAHSAMTGGKASMSDEIGAAISAWDGYITGRNLHLVRGKRIVQSWRTSRFTDAHADSIVTITLRAAASGTVLMLEHSNVPDDQRNYEDGGWEENYFAPMKDYFADRARQSGEKQPRLAPAKKKTRAKRAPSATTPKKAREAPRKKQRHAKPMTRRAGVPKTKRRRQTQPAKRGKQATRAARKTGRRQRVRR
ncbi:MAG: SRPBCC domain-containing protein [Xanthobacteraceae bacterium]|jgi:uncharacterized protein YndB with AHSA1/START domain